MRLFKPFSLSIGLRYCFSRSHPAFVSLASLSAIIGIALGIAILIVVMSVMNGFVDEVRGHLSTVSHHIVFKPWHAQSDGRKAQDWLQKQEAVCNVHPFVQVQSLMKVGELSRPVLLESTPMHNPALPKGQFVLRINGHLAKEYRLSIDQHVQMVSANLRMGMLGMMPTFRRFTIGAIAPASSKNSEQRYRVWTDFQSAQKLAGLSGNAFTGLSITLHDPETAAFLVKQWQPSLEHLGWLHAWSDDYVSFFQSIIMQKAMMFLVLMLIVAMAVFSLISGLVMLVANKRTEIAILKTMGWSFGDIAMVFLTHGLCCALLGMLLGTSMGILIAHHVTGIVQLIESWLGAPWLSHALYMMDHMPSSLHVGDVVMINGATLLLGMVATAFPAWQATRVEPVSVLKAGGV